MTNLLEPRTRRLTVFPRVLGARYFHHLCGAGGEFFNEVSRSQEVRVQVINTCNGTTIQSFADEVDLVTFNITDHHNFHLAEEMESLIVDSVAKNGLLNENDIATRLLDLLTNVQDVLSLFTKNTVHLRVIGHDHIVLHVSLGR